MGNSRKSDRINRFFVGQSGLEYSRFEVYWSGDQITLEPFDPFERTPERVLISSVGVFMYLPQFGSVVLVGDDRLSRVEIPAGAVETSDRDPRDTAVRETFEETDIGIGAAGLQLISIIGHRDISNRAKVPVFVGGVQFYVPVEIDLTTLQGRFYRDRDGRGYLLRPNPGNSSEEMRWVIFEPIEIFFHPDRSLMSGRTRNTWAFPPTTYLNLFLAIKATTPELLQDPNIARWWHFWSALQLTLYA